MTEPFESLEEVLEAAIDLQALKSSIEIDIIVNSDPPAKKDVIQLLALAEDMMDQLKIEFGP